MLAGLRGGGGGLSRARNKPEVAQSKARGTGWQAQLSSLWFAHPRGDPEETFPVLSGQGNFLGGQGQAHGLQVGGGNV